MLRSALLFVVLALVVLAVMTGSLNAGPVSALGNYGQAVLDAGPVGYWRLETNEGTIAADTAEAPGHPQDGPQDGVYQDMSLADRGQPGPRPTDLVNGQPLLGFAADNHAPNFQGDEDGNGNDVVLIPDDGNLDFAAGGAFSVEAWIKAPPGQEHGSPIAAKGTGNGGETFAVDVVDDKFRVYGWDSQGGLAFHVHTDAMVNGDWQHVAATADVSQGQAKFYVNGQEVGSAPTNGLDFVSNNHEVSVGSRQSADDLYDLNLGGLLDEVAIFDRALSGAEVQAHFDAAFVPIPEPSTLMLSLPGLISVAGFARRRRRA